MHIKPKRVWLLGAGFSRPLGGPLLSDLLSLGTQQAIAGYYQDQFADDPVEGLLWFFHFGSGFPDGSLDPRIRPTGVRRWRDAEQFLEVIDAAGDDSALAGELSKLWELMAGQLSELVLISPFPGPSELASLARRAVCAACSAFVEGVSPESARKKERWLPYQQWLGLLRGEDSIITFNYDRVLELLKPSVFIEGSEYIWGVRVRSARDSSEAREKDALAQAQRLPYVYKLHGSVDWTIAAGGITRNRWNSSLLGRDHEPAIATPGSHKMELAGNQFALLWQQAEECVAAADEIYLIGFRFPESDAFPRARLLAALRRNTADFLRVFTILGPDVQGLDSRRIISLLTWTLGAETEVAMGLSPGEAKNPRKRILLPQPLWTQDFLTVWAAREAERIGVRLPTADEPHRSS